MTAWPRIVIVDDEGAAWIHARGGCILTEPGALAAALASVMSTGGSAARRGIRP